MTGEPRDAVTATKDTDAADVANRASAAPKEHDGRDDDSITQLALQPTRADGIVSASG